MTFTRTVTIAAPPEIVWVVMSDAEHWHEWTSSVTSIRVIGGGGWREPRPRSPSAISTWRLPD